MYISRRDSTKDPNNPPILLVNNLPIISMNILRNNYNKIYPRHKYNINEIYTSLISSRYIYNLKYHRTFTHTTAIYHFVALSTYTNSYSVTEDFLFSAYCDEKRDDKRDEKGAVGGIHPVKGFKNSLEFQNLARFAVDEHNKKQNALLEFKKVTNVKQQLVAGTMYYITLEAAEGGQKKVYEAEVWLQPWIKFKEVQEFKLVGDA